MTRAWTAIGAPAGHVAELVGGRVRCSCTWSAKARTLAAAHAAHVRHVQLVALLDGNPHQSTRGAA